MKLLIVGLGSMGKRRARLTKGIDAAIQIVRGVHADDLNSRVNAFGPPGAAVAQSASNDDEKFPTKTPLCGSNSGTGPA